MTRVGRIPYVNCYPVYGAIDRGLVRLDGTLVDGVPSALNRAMADGALDVSVVSAVEYARDADRYLLLPDLAISCDGPVRSVLLFSDAPAESLGGRRVIVSRSSMTSVALLELLFEHVWRSRPEFVPGDAEVTDLAAFERGAHRPARLVIGDAALMLAARDRYPVRIDLGAEWKAWTGLPFVFAVWAARRDAATTTVRETHRQLLVSREWGLAHLDELAHMAAERTGVAEAVCREYLGDLDYALSYRHLAGLTDFFSRLAQDGLVPDGSLSFISAA